MEYAHLLVLPLLYTPSEDTFNDFLKSGINLPLADGIFRLKLDVPVYSFGYATQFSFRGHHVIECHPQTPRLGDLVPVRLAQLLVPEIRAHNRAPEACPDRAEQVREGDTGGVRRLHVDVPR